MSTDELAASIGAVMRQDALARGVDEGFAADDLRCTQSTIRQVLLHPVGGAAHRLGSAGLILRDRDGGDPVIGLQEVVGDETRRLAHGLLQLLQLRSRVCGDRG